MTAMHNLPSVVEGTSCPITPTVTKRPMWKRVLLFFFRFGICPACVTMSIAYAIVTWARRQMQPGAPPTPTAS